MTTGLDEGKPTAKQTSAKASRFDELLGGKKEKNEPKPSKPKTLDDFMSSISTGSGKKSTEKQPKKGQSKSKSKCITMYSLICRDGALVCLIFMGYYQYFDSSCQHKRETVISCIHYCAETLTETP